MPKTNNPRSQPAPNLSQPQRDMLLHLCHEDAYVPQDGNELRTIDALIKRGMAVWVDGRGARIGEAGREYLDGRHAK